MHILNFSKSDWEFKKDRKKEKKIVFCLTEMGKEKKPYRLMETFFF